MKPIETSDERIARLKAVLESYKGEPLEFLPLNGGKLIIPDDVKFLLDEIQRLDQELEAMTDAFDNTWR